MRGLTGPIGCRVEGVVDPIGFQAVSILECVCVCVCVWGGGAIGCRTEESES